MIIPRAVLLASLAAAPVAAQSQPQIEKRYSPDYNPCIEASGGVTSEMMSCTGAEIDRQDARLNQAYTMVMRALPPAKKVALRNSERAWVKARDARCYRDSASMRGGSGEGILYSGCILEETIKRTVFLENYGTLGGGKR